MDWEIQLISLYLFICKHYPSQLASYCERKSSYTNLQFSDEEAITLYLYGIMEGYHTLKAIHNYARKHLKDWFPHLPSYGAFDQRMNQIHDVFIPLVDLIATGLADKLPTCTALMDSMPIIMAQQGRRFHAKVAPGIASANGYCAAKKLHFYGVRLHVVAYRRAGALPLPVCIGLIDAGTHDRKAFEHIAPFLPEQITECFADKAYQVADKPIHKEGEILLLTPVKKKKGQKLLDAADNLLSTAISRVRQPIESFFNWIQEKTGLQIASKVRSYEGLIVHTFGKLAAALLMLQISQSL